MSIHFLLVLHIIVLGYWLGSELVINSTYKYVSWSRNMPFAERDRLMQHVMHVDQHVRYALVLQFTLGFALAAQRGYIPGGSKLAWLIGFAGVAWLILVEVVHRKRLTTSGQALATFDRLLRYALMAALLVIAVAGWRNYFPLPMWLSLKLACFAAVMACGVGIRLELIKFFTLWKTLGERSATDSDEASIRSIYTRATAILILLWVFIGLIVYLSVWKPL